MAVIENQISEDLKQAMLQKDADKLRGLRSIKAAFMQAKTEKGAGGQLSDEKAMSILQKLLKQRQESLDIYQKQNRPDLAEIEEIEAEIIRNYLPKPLSEEQLQKEVENIISDTGASGMKDMGVVMKEANARLKGKAEGKALADMVKKLLGE